MAMIDKPKVLLAHNSYLERGGEDHSFEAEKKLLLEHGHEVCIYVRTNDEIKSYNYLQTLSLPLRTISAWDSKRDIRALILKEKPDLAHFNNTFPLISPGVYDTCQKMQIPVIQNLRNYRLLCPSAIFFRDHRVCEDCMGRFVPWPGVLHACYRSSRVQSSVVAGMIAYHRLRATWSTDVDLYMALTEFSRQKFVEGGLPAEKIVVRPNFAYDHGQVEDLGNYALFIGRLDESKGLFNLLNAWKSCRNIPLKIAGDGPSFGAVRKFVADHKLHTVELRGQVPASEITGLIKGARFVVFPSIWYEAFPRVILESFSCGRTVIASDLGSSPEIIDHGRVGMLFKPTDPQDLSEKVNQLWNMPQLCRHLGSEARKEYQLRYTPELAYRSLMQIYGRVLSQAR